MLVTIISLFFLLVNSEYTMVWNDEFDGPNVDTTKWDYEINCWGGGNNEQQCYIHSDSTLSIQNGTLVFHPVYWPGGYTGSLDGCTDNTEYSCTRVMPVTSARIRTLRARSWKYAKFEFRAKLPIGNFLWPAIWLLPSKNIYGSWASSGEIDIVEFRGQPSDYNLLEQTIHYGAQWPFNVYIGTGKKAYPVNFTDDFHIFTFEWTSEQMKWYVDDIQGFEVSLNQSFALKPPANNPYTRNYQPFDQEFHIILNLAVAGYFFPNNIYGTFSPVNDTKTWASNFQIDYVRVYQEGGLTEHNSASLSVWTYWSMGIISLLGLIVIILLFLLHRRRSAYNILS
jgi:beta-glucanase (GH16 family)